MSELYQITDKEIEYGYEDNEIMIYIKSNENGNIWALISFEVIENLYREIQSIKGGEK